MASRRSPRLVARPAFGPPIPVGTAALMGIVLTASLLVALLQGTRFGATAYATLAFSPADVARGQVWQLVTYSLLSLDVLGLLFALLGIWMFGAPIELRRGTPRFLLTFFGAAALAALGTAAIAWPLGAWSVSHASVWPPLEAMLVLFALENPDAQVLLWMVPLRAKSLIWLSAAFSVVTGIMIHSLIAVVPNLCGLGAGFLLARRSVGMQAFFKRLWLRLRVRGIHRQMRNRNLRVLHGESDKDLPDRRSGGRGSDRFLH